MLDIGHSNNFKADCQGLAENVQDNARLTLPDQAILAKQYWKLYLMEWTAVAERYEWAEWAPEAADGKSAAARWAGTLNI